MHLLLGLWRVASDGLGAVALLRLGAIPDSRLANGVRTRICWAAVVVLGGMGALVPLGPAWVCWRTPARLRDDELARPAVPPVPLADGVEMTPPTGRVWAGPADEGHAADRGEGPASSAPWSGDAA